MVTFSISFRVDSAEIVEQCDRNGVKIDQVCVDPELSTQLGLTEGATLPHGCRPTVHVEPGLGRQLLFKRGQGGRSKIASADFAWEVQQSNRRSKFGKHHSGPRSNPRPNVTAAMTDSF